jgi:A/G-specific adenine glycosylase
MVFVRKAGRILLRRRASEGIWGGLWAPPEFADARMARRWCAVIAADAVPRRLPTLRHAFTHFDLDISPWVLDIPRGGRAAAGRGGRWLAPGMDTGVGVPAPVAKLLAAGLSAGAGAKESANGENGELRAARARGGRPRSRAVSRGAGPAHP